MVSQFVAMISSNIHQARTLAALRDILLPKLMSGELRIKQEEGEVEEALA
jgi:type I restriction enzyme S subunit